MKRYTVKTKEGEEYKYIEVFGLWEVSNLFLVCTDNRKLTRIIPIHEIVSIIEQ